MLNHILLQYIFQEKLSSWNVIQQLMHQTNWFFQMSESEPNTLIPPATHFHTLFLCANCYLSNKVLKFKQVTLCQDFLQNNQNETRYVPTQLIKINSKNSSQLVVTYLSGSRKKPMQADIANISQKTYICDANEIWNFISISTLHYYNASDNSFFRYQKAKVHNHSKIY